MGSEGLWLELGPLVGGPLVGGHAHEQNRVPTHAAWDRVVFFAHAKLKILENPTSSWYLVVFLLQPKRQNRPILITFFANYVYSYPQYDFFDRF